MCQVSPFALGATLYMPATRPDLLAVMGGIKLPGLRSLVICLEDAIAESDTAVALAACAVRSLALPVPRRPAGVRHWYLSAPKMPKWPRC